MHAVIRRYRVRLGTVAQAVRYAEKQFVPLARRIPGFVGCYLVDAGNDVLTSIGLFHTQEGAEAAISLQRDWFRDEWSSFRPLPPEVVAGAVLAQATVDGAVPAERGDWPIGGTQPPCCPRVRGTAPSAGPVRIDGPAGGPNGARSTQDRLAGRAPPVGEQRDEVIRRARAA